MITNLNNAVQPLRELLTAGVPKWHVLDIASKNVIALKALDDSVENKQEAIVVLENFIKELET